MEKLQGVLGYYEYYYLIRIVSTNNLNSEEEPVEKYCCVSNSELSTVIKVERYSKLSKAVFFCMYEMEIYRVRLVES